jgi:hypothetical protein
MSRTLVIGLGTGRCGTHTLAALLTMQPEAAVTHERFGTALHWQGSEHQVRALIAAWCAAPSAGGLPASDQIYGDVHSAYLPYANLLLDTSREVRMVCLRRDRGATVASFLEKTKRKANHWAPTSRFARRARWSDCFPTYSADLPKPEAIARYWDEYYAEAERLAERRPQQIHVFPMEALNSEAGQREILDFIGIARASQQVDPGLRLNIETPRRHGPAKLLDWLGL